MNIKRIIGVVLLLGAARCIFITHSDKVRIRSGFDAARETPILTSDQIELGDSATIAPTYIYAHHKLLIRNAEKKKEDQSPFLSLKFAEGNIWELVYSKEGEDIWAYVGDSPITVTKNRESKDEIQFLNFSCGCENLGPSIFYYGSLAFGAVILPIGLLLTFKKSSNKSE